MLLNPFTFREIQLRGLVATGRAAEAIRIMQTGQVDGAPAASQWHIIERVTAGQVHLAAGDRNGAIEALHTALIAAKHTGCRIKFSAQSAQHKVVASLRSVPMATPRCCA